MSEIATPEENSVIETPEYQDEIETMNVDGEIIKMFATGKRDHNDRVTASIDLILAIAGQWIQPVYGWRYPGENEWRR